MALYSWPLVFVDKMLKFNNHGTLVLVYAWIWVNTLVMADYTHKKWSDAKFFNEFYDDQNVISIGVQKTMGNLKLTCWLWLCR